MLQALLFVTSISAAYLVNDHRPTWRRWGPVAGLCSQPIWIHETVAAQQWGMVALAVVYTALWARGLYNAWWRKA